MSNWHEEGCRRPDVSVSRDWMPFCQSCGSLVTTESFQPHEALPLPCIAPATPRAKLDLTWPSCVRYSPTCILNDIGEDLTPKLVQLLDIRGSNGSGTANQTSRDSNTNNKTVLDRPQVDEAIEGERRSFSESLQGHTSPRANWQKAETHQVLATSNHIRLLHLSKGTPQDPIHGDLTPRNLKDLPQFEALSYTWAGKDGDATRCKKMFLGPFWDVLPITANCEAALRRLRQRDEARVIWVDSICINQDDNIERSHQVGLMREIYAAAFRVLIYAGGGDADTDQAIDAICGLYDLGVSSSTTSIRNFFMQPYFARIWIVQEIAMARLAAVYCGTRSLSWSKIFQPNIIEKINLDMGPAWIQHCERPRLMSTEDFPRLLIDTYRCRSSDPRDKVFALLGLIQESNQEGVVADYSLSVEQVYVGLAANILVNHPTCRILRYRNSNPVLPSWVPDWSIPPPSPDLESVFETGWAQGEDRFSRYMTIEEFQDFEVELSNQTESPDTSLRPVHLRHSRLEDLLSKKVLLLPSLESQALTSTLPSRPKSSSIHQKTGALTTCGYKLANLDALGSFGSLKGLESQLSWCLYGELKNGWKVFGKPIGGLWKERFEWLIAFDKKFFETDCVFFLGEHEICLHLRKQPLNNVYRIIGECAVAGAAHADALGMFGGNVGNPQAGNGEACDVVHLLFHELAKKLRISMAEDVARVCWDLFDSPFGVFLREKADPRCLQQTASQSGVDFSSAWARYEEHIVYRVNRYQHVEPRATFRGLADIFRLEQEVDVVNRVAFFAGKEIRELIGKFSNIGDVEDLWSKWLVQEQDLTQEVRRSILDKSIFGWFALNSLTFRQKIKGLFSQFGVLYGITDVPWKIDLCGPENFSRNEAGAARQVYLSKMVPRSRRHGCLIAAIAYFWECSDVLLPIITDQTLFPEPQEQEAEPRPKIWSVVQVDKIFNQIVRHYIPTEHTQVTIPNRATLKARMESLIELIEELGDHSEATRTILYSSSSLEDIIQSRIWTCEQIIIV